MTTMPPDPQQPGGIPGGYQQPPPGPNYGGAPGYPPVPGYLPPGQQYGGMRPPLASWGLRVGATLVDGLVAFAAFLPFLIIGGAAGSFGLIMLGYLAMFGVWIWQMVKQGETGQTIGKKALNIKLLREADGQPVGAGMSIARYFIHFVDGMPCGVGYLWPLWDEKKQTFTDKIMTTVVVTT